MSPIIMKAGVALGGALLLLSVGCSDARSPRSLINPETGRHAAAWETPDSHGAAAKAAVTSTTGFSTCQECHRDDFTGGMSNITCMNTAGCHGAGVNAPHSPAPWRGGTRTHVNTDQSNAPICASCHTNGANSSVQPSTFDPAAAPGCFNNTLCHSTPVHPVGWQNPDSHGVTAKGTPGATAGFSLCQTCHGNDFAGGTALKTCLNTAGCHGSGVNAPHSPIPWRGGTRTHTSTNPNNATVCALCHTNGANSTVQPSPYDPIASPGCFNNTLCHADVGAPHAVPFIDPTLHGPLAKADLTYCQACHADPSNSGAGSNPRFNVAKGSLATGCEGASCHATNTAHPVPWKWATATSHQTAGNMTNACVLCHGVALAGGAGPACSTCHTAGSPLTQTNCTSCHGKPPTGAVSPNVAGKHGKHDALANITGVCNTCHNGAGTNTANHDYSGGVVNVAFLGTTYNAKTGTASYNAGGFTCSNVSCHGGQTTPSWLTGTITLCTSCHAFGTSQYNSYDSGEHSKHLVDVGADCIDCHDTSKLATVHFNDLNTTIMLQSGQTMTNVYNTSGKYCAFTCHLYGTDKLHDSEMKW
ncbi:MAG: CxxxxCH/CxxCH domain-containing protein [Nitrospirae bacterium]|nr:CxxxxCH/CxxCH domain-containing protein [Nitrospirota bacterium]